MDTEPRGPQAQSAGEQPRGPSCLIPVPTGRTPSGPPAWQALRGKRARPAACGRRPSPRVGPESWLPWAWRPVRAGLSPPASWPEEPLPLRSTQLARPRRKPCREFTPCPRGWCWRVYFRNFLAAPHPRSSREREEGMEIVRLGFLGETCAHACPCPRPCAPAPLHPCAGRGLPSPGPVQSPTRVSGGR